jgi:hypothetical protein
MVCLGLEAKDSKSNQLHSITFCTDGRSNRIYSGSKYVGTDGSSWASGLQVYQ